MGEPIAVSGRTALAGVRLPVDPSTLLASFWPDPWDALAVDKPNSLALRIASVAAGTADGFFEGRTVAEWDIAAAALIVAEAGGAITDRDNRALAFNRSRPALDGIVAATPALVEPLRLRLAAGIAAWRAQRR